MYAYIIILKLVNEYNVGTKNVNIGRHTTRLKSTILARNIDNSLLWVYNEIKDNYAT
jgi:hypothetical protein